MEVETYARIIQRHYRKYDQALDSGEYIPFVLPYHILSYALISCCLVFSSWRSTTIRWCTLFAVVLHSVLAIRYSRSIGLAHGVVVGIAASWSVLTAINLLFIHCPEKTFQRMVPGKTSPVSKPDAEDVDEVLETRLVWQPMPSQVMQRLFWVTDLLGSMRLLHWSTQKVPDQKIPITHANDDYYATLSLSRCLVRFSLIYLAIDVLKEVVAIDPYFWGYTQTSAPRSIAQFVSSPLFISLYRLSVASMLIYLAIALITEAGHIFFIHVLGPRVAGAWGQRWAYRPQHGGLSSIYMAGLRGFWGTFWHQMFRHMLTSTSNGLMMLLGSEMQGSTATERRLTMSFLISGTVHACGSYTMWGNTQPLHAALFFLLQPIGIRVQSFFVRILDHTFENNTGYHARGIANVVSTGVFLFLTFPFLADDFAKGGLYLSEPFPISIIQLLKLGSSQRAHPLWMDSGIGWYTGRRWWQSGIAL